MGRPDGPGEKSPRPPGSWADFPQGSVLALLQAEFHTQKHTHTKFWFNPAFDIFPVLLTNACMSLWQLRKQSRIRKTILKQ